MDSARLRAFGLMRLRSRPLPTVLRLLGSIVLVVVAVLAVLDARDSDPVASDWIEVGEVELEKELEDERESDEDARPTADGGYAPFGVFASRWAHGHGAPHAGEPIPVFKPPRA